jgi:hypothetical protein
MCFLLINFTDGDQTFYFVIGRPKLSTKWRNQLEQAFFFFPFSFRLWFKKAAPFLFLLEFLDAIKDVFCTKDSS